MAMFLETVATELAGRKGANIQENLSFSGRLKCNLNLNRDGETKHNFRSIQNTSGRGRRQGPAERRRDCRWAQQDPSDPGHGLEAGTERTGSLVCWPQEREE
jgi:hypothetical protein